MRPFDIAMILVSCYAQPWGDGRISHWHEYREFRDSYGAPIPDWLVEAALERSMSSYLERIGIMESRHWASGEWSITIRSATSYRRILHRGGMFPHKLSALLSACRALAPRTEVPA